MNVSLPTIASILPLVLGGTVSYFKPFLEDQKEFKARGLQLLERHTEAISIVLVRLLKEEIRGKDFDEVTRGLGTISSPDYYSDVSLAISKLVKIQFRVSRRMILFRYCYGALLISVFVALLLFICSTLSLVGNSLILTLAILLSVMQISAVGILYMLTRRSEDDDEIS